MPHRLHWQARLQPEAIAYRDDACVRTYRQMSLDVHEASHILKARTATTGARIVIWSQKSYACVVAILATLQADRIAVPVNSTLKRSQLDHIVADCGPQLVLLPGKLLAEFTAPAYGCSGLSLEFLLELPGALDLEADPGIADVPAVSESRPACILYTSGSTGLPKGVVLSHRNLTAGADSVTSYLDLKSSDSVLGILPLAFDAGLSQLTTALTAGACYVGMNYLLAREVPGICRRHGVTVITAVPPLWHQLANANWQDDERRQVRRVASTGGVMPGEVLDAVRSTFPRADVFLMYGLTEAFRSTYLPPADLDRKPGSIGRAIPNAEVLVLREDGTECAAGEAGELVHVGPTVTMGYWNHPELTALRFRRFCRHPEIPGAETAVWSGDIVKRDEEGFLFFIGRRDDQIKRMGYRISPSEVEQALHVSGLLDAAVVFGLPDDVQGHRLIACVASSEPKINVADLELHCARVLPSYMCPGAYITFQAFPLNPNGKVDRQAVILQAHAKLRNTEQAP